MERMMKAVFIFVILLVAGWGSVLGSAWFWSWLLEVPFNTALLYVVALGYGANASFNAAKRVLK
jgi:uncharacterized membrane protein AbrB (regulator of aidB expression)